MRFYSVAEVDDHFHELLDLVKSGEVIALTENGEKIAELHPVVLNLSQRDDFSRLKSDIVAFRAKASRVTIDELMEWRREGQKG